MTEAPSAEDTRPADADASDETRAALSPSPSLWLRVERAMGLLDQPVALTFRSHGHPDWLRVKGRVLESKGVHSPDEDDGGTLLENALASFHRMESDEIPGARIRASYQGGSWEAVSDEEGYFSFRFETESPAEPGWHEVPLEVEVPLTDDRFEVTAPVLVPSPDAAFAVLSDLDDTVVKTHSTDTLSQIRMVFGRNAASRPPLPGVGALYRALAEGGGGGPNPIFYVSLSGWNLYDLFDDLMEFRDIPHGPFFMQDLNVVDDPSATIAHDAPKLERAGILLENYPDLDFILVGDSGQADAETYRRVVQRHPGRILAIYIRDVTPDEETDRDRTVEAVAEEVRAKGVPMILAPDSVTMAEHARDVLGILDDDAVERVRNEMRADGEE